MTCKRQAPTSACARAPLSPCAPAADSAKGLSWEDRFWGQPRRQGNGAQFLPDESDGVLLYTDRTVDPPCFPLSPLAFHHESSPCLPSPGMMPLLPRSPTVGALPLANTSLPKLNTPGQSPLTTPKLLSVFSPLLGSLTPRRLFGTARITELNEEAPDLPTTDTSFTFPSPSFLDSKDGVKSTGDNHRRQSSREGSPANGLVLMPGLLALPEVAPEEGSGKATDPQGSPSNPFAGFLSSPGAPILTSARAKGSPPSRSTLLSLTPRGDALPSPGFPEGEDDFFFAAFSQNMSPLHSPRFLNSPAASPFTRAALLNPQSPFKASKIPASPWRAGITSPLSSLFGGRKPQDGENSH